jgi:hypothetical protein
MSVLPVLPHQITHLHIATSETEATNGRETLSRLAYKWFSGWGLGYVDSVSRRIEEAILKKLHQPLSLVDDGDLDIIEQYGSKLSDSELCAIWHASIDSEDELAQRAAEAMQLSA